MTAAPEEIESQTMLISIHPEHVQSILDGRKTIELRRRRPRVRPGDQVLIYATSPVAAVTVRCRIRAVESLPPDALWQLHSAQLGVSEDDYYRYFEGATTATALHLYDVAPLARSVPLAALRRSGVFHPPQTWHFLEPARVVALLSHGDDHVTTDLSRIGTIAWLGALLRRISSRPPVHWGRRRQRPGAAGLDG